MLSEDGIPKELLHLFEKSDASLEKLQPQKAATPVGGRVTEGDAFKDMRPNAVTDERSGQMDGDMNSNRVSAFQRLVQKLQSGKEDAEKLKEELVVSTGNQMMDQFKPWYFAVAFAFCFNSLLAQPDLEGEGKRSNSALLLDVLNPL